MLAGLWQRVLDFRQGRLELDEFRQCLETSQANVVQVFDTLRQTMGEVLSELPGYRQSVTETLDDCQSLFDVGLQELSSGESGGLRFGWLLLEKAEQEYLRLNARLQRESSGDWQPGPDEMGRLVEGYREGRFTLEQFYEGIEHWAQEVLTRLDTTAETLTQCREEALRYTGGELELLIDCRTRLDHSADLLAEVVLTLKSGVSQPDIG